MLRDRIKKVREALFKGSQDEFAQVLGWPNSRIKDLERGKVKELKATEAEQLEEKFLVNGWWLLTGKGEMVPNSASNTIDPSLMSIQHISNKASAGSGNHLESIDRFEIVETMTVSRSLLKTSPNGTLRMISVDGYSMVPMLYPDTMVLFDEHPEWKGDGLYILNWRNELMVKLLQIDPKGSLHIKSVNKDYESWTVDPDDQSVFSIVGKVLRIII